VVPACHIWITKHCILVDSVRELENFTADLFERQVDSFFRKE
jgi:hypothetical protein